MNFTILESIRLVRIYYSGQKKMALNSNHDLNLFKVLQLLRQSILL